MLESHPDVERAVRAGVGASRTRGRGVAYVYFYFYFAPLEGG